MNVDRIARLLGEGEGVSLDFKRRQYGFVGASDDVKARLLKDLLSMANSWRQDDAFILVGVEERPGQLAHVVGIDEHVDDAQLQQFVSSKTNRPLLFEYQEVAFGDRTVAVIRIPCQERPVFLRRPFGGLSAGMVYIRRGSSNETADPDEVHRMGREVGLDLAPVLSLEFCDAVSQSGLGESVEIAGWVLDGMTTAEVELAVQSERVASAWTAGVKWAATTGYYEALRDTIITRHSVVPIALAVRNHSLVTAASVRIESVLTCSEDVTVLERVPAAPRIDGAGGRSEHQTSVVAPESKGTDHVRFREGRWFWACEFGRIQPGAAAFCSKPILVGTRTPASVLVQTRVFADNMRPFDRGLIIVSKPRRRPMERSDVEKALSEAGW